jgi:hypothetical protein
LPPPPPPPPPPLLLLLLLLLLLPTPSPSAFKTSDRGKERGAVLYLSRIPVLKHLRFCVFQKEN